MPKIKKFLQGLAVIMMMGSCLVGLMYQWAESLPPGPNEFDMPDAAAGPHVQVLSLPGLILKPAAAQ